MKGEFRFSATLGAIALLHYCTIEEKGRQCVLEKSNIVVNK